MAQKAYPGKKTARARYKPFEAKVLTPCFNTLLGWKKEKHMNWNALWNSIKPNLVFAGKVAAGTVIAMGTQSLVITANSTLQDWRENAKTKKKLEEKEAKQAA